jgi:BirA family biotin operon repressor/biotin-[acetyl-CoA-carboxylase] ligase
VDGPTTLAGLSLAVGVALARALRTFLPRDVGLKWPNDLVWHGQKLAGILVEIAGESAGPSYAVIGVGINVRMPTAASDNINQPWTDLYRISQKTPSRNALAAAVLEQLATVLCEFERQGLSVFLDEWRRLDSMAGRNVQIHMHDSVIAGTAKGIDDNGALMLQVGDELRRFASGEVSLRMAQ